MKLQQLREKFASIPAKYYAAVALTLAAASAKADPTTLDTVLDTFVASIITGIGTTFAKVGPLLALVFGVAFAWRWIKKGSKS